MNELIIGFLAFAAGILFGMSLQWRRNEARINELEGWYITLWHTIDTQAEYIDALEGDDDDFDQDDPEYVARVEDTLRHWDDDGQVAVDEALVSGHAPIASRTE